MAMNVGKQIAALKRMTVTELREKHVAVFGDPTRSRHKEFLWKRIAWRLQANAEGDLSQRARRRAKQLARDVDIRLRPPVEMDMPPIDRPADVRQPARKYIRRNLDARLPMPGTRLKRDYKGHTYEVEVLDNGFAYDGEVYQSLSAGATAERMRYWLDIPWCRADLYYIEKLVLCIEAHGRVSWEPLR